MSSGSSTLVQCSTLTPSLPTNWLQRSRFCSSGVEPPPSPYSFLSWFSESNPLGDAPVKLCQRQRSMACRESDSRMTRLNPLSQARSSPKAKLQISAERLSTLPRFIITPAFQTPFESLMMSLHPAAKPPFRLEPSMLHLVQPKVGACHATLISFLTVSVNFRISELFSNSLVAIIIPLYRLVESQSSPLKFQALRLSQILRIASLKVSFQFKLSSLPTSLLLLNIDHSVISLLKNSCQCLGFTSIFQRSVTAWQSWEHELSSPRYCHIACIRGQWLISSYISENL